MTKKKLIEFLDDVKDNEQLIVAYWTKDSLEEVYDEKISNAKWDEIVDQSYDIDWSSTNDDIHDIVYEAVNNNGIRVYDLAKRYNLTSKDFIQLLEDEFGIRTYHLSTLDSDTVEDINIGFVKKKVLGNA